MKYVKIIVFILVILFLIICIRLHNVNTAYNNLFISANELNLNNLKIEGI